MSCVTVTFDRDEARDLLYLMQDARHDRLHLSYGSLIEGDLCNVLDRIGTRIVSAIRERDAAVAS